MIISFYIFFIVFILTNGDPNRRTRQTNTELDNLNDVLLTDNDIIPDGAIDNNNVSNNSNESKINDVSEQLEKITTLNNVKAVSTKNKDKVRKIFTKKIFKPKTQSLNSEVADGDTILAEKNTNATVSNITTNLETNTTFERRVKKVKRVKVNKKLIKVNNSESSLTETTLNQTPQDLTTEVIFDTTTVISPSPAESTSTINPITLITKPTTKLASKYTKFAPKRRPLAPKVNTEKSLDAPTTETPTIETATIELTTNNLLEPTAETFANSNDVPSTENTISTSPQEISSTTQKSFTLRLRRPTSTTTTTTERPLDSQTSETSTTKIIKNDIILQTTLETAVSNNDIPSTDSTINTISVEVTPTIQSSYSSRRRRPSPRLVTEVPLNTQTNEPPTTEIIKNNIPIQKSTQTYATNNNVQTTERTLDTITVTTTTQRSYNSRRRQPSSRFITEKPLDVKVTPVETTQNYANNNQWNIRAQASTRYYSNQAVTTALPVTEVTQNPWRRRTTFSAPTEKPGLSEVTGTYVPTYAHTNYRNDPSLLDTRSEQKPTVQVPIIDLQNFVYGHSGNFHYSYEGADGTKASEKGTLRSSNKGSGQAVEGSFSYKDKDGTDYNLSYTADENGYRPVGAHLPTPPPIPPAIQRVLSILATKTTPEPVTEKIKAN